MDSIAVLIIETDSAVTTVIKEALTDAPGNRCLVEASLTLGEALDLLAHKRFEVVLLALHLPDAAGLDLVRTLATRYPDMAIVILCEPRDEQIAIQATHYGAQDYLHKRQVTPVLLRRSLYYAMERKKALREKTRLLADLSNTVELIGILQNILPICACCKRRRNRQGTCSPPATPSPIRPPVFLERCELDICLACAATAHSSQKTYFQ